MKNIGQMAHEGKLAIAGPFGKNEVNFRGLYIFNVGTIEEARKLTDTDPAVQSGLLQAEFFPWYGSAALMKVNEIHPKIAEEKF